MGVRERYYQKQNRSKSTSSTEQTVKNGVRERRKKKQEEQFVNVRKLYEFKIDTPAKKQPTTGFMSDGGRRTAVDDKMQRDAQVAKIQRERMAADKAAQKYGWDSDTVNAVQKQISRENESRKLKAEITTNRTPFASDSSDNFAKIAQNKAEEKEYNKKYSYAEKQLGYSDVINSDDYEEQSSKRDFANASHDEFAAYTTLLQQAVQNRTELPKEPVINDKLGMFLSTSAEERKEAYQALVGSENQWEKVIKDGNDKSWDYLTDEEIGIYYYLYNTSGQDAAYDYLEDMSVSLNKRQTDEATQRMQDTINNGGIAERIALSAASIPINVFGGAVAFADDALRMAQGKELNPYSSAHQFTNTAQNIRNSTYSAIENSTDIEFFGRNVLAEAYNAVMSAGDSMLGAFTIGKGYSFVMGAGAASTEAARLYEQGASNEQIIAGALSAGAAEMIFERFSIERLLKTKNTSSFGDVVVDVLKQAGVEATEETATEIANKISNRIIMGEDSDYAQAVLYYQNAGYTEAEAKKLAAWDAAKDIIWSGISGFASGGVSSGVVSGTVGAVNYAAENSHYRDIAKNVIKSGSVPQLAEQAQQYDSLRQLAEEVAGVNTDNLTRREARQYTKDVKNLYKATEKETMTAARNSKRETTKTAAVNILKQKLTDDPDSLSSLGITVDVDSDGKPASELSADTQTDIEFIAEAATRLIHDEDVKSEDRRIVERIGGKSFLTEVLNSSTAPTAQAESKAETVVNSADFSAPQSLKVSGTGKTVVTDKSGKQEFVNIQRIENISSDGTVKLKLNNGSVVDSTDVTYGSNKQAVIYEAVADMDIDRETANTFVSMASSSVPADTDLQGWMTGAKMVYYDGLYGMPVADIKNQAFTDQLTESEKGFIYNLGRTYSQKKAKIAEQRIKSKKKALPKASVKNSKVTFNGQKNFSTEGFSDIQRASVSAAKVISEITGVEIQLFESENINGRWMYVDENGEAKAAPNGMYISGTNTIMLDINSGINGEGTILYTLSHELVHFIKEWSPAKFETLSSFLMEQYGKKGQSVEELVQAQIRKAKSNGRNISYAAAYEEVIADSMEGMLTDGNVVAKLQQLYNQDKSLFNKISDFIKKWVNKIKQLYSQYAPNSAEGKFVLEMKDTLEDLQTKFAEAIYVASGNVTASFSISKSDIKAQARDIVSGMSEADRADVLRKKKIAVTNVRNRADISVAELSNGKKMGEFSKELVKKLIELGCISKYESPELDIEFELTIRGLRESIQKQKEYGGNYEDLTQVISNLPALLTNATLIESHTDKAKGTKKENRDLKEVYVLISLLHDGTNVFPVQFEVKEYFNQDNKLYITVALTKIETGVVNRTVLNDEAQTDLVPISNINISELFSKINPIDKNFLKYVPNEFLNEIQLEAKEKALRRENAKYGKNVENIMLSDRQYLEAVNLGDTVTAQRMVDEAAKAAGYNSPMLYHGTESFGFTEFDLSRMDDKRCIFLTNNERIASTYSGVSGKRAIAHSIDNDIGNMTVSEVVDKLNELSDDFYKDGSAEKGKYEYFDITKTNALIAIVNQGIDSLKQIVAVKIKDYAVDSKTYNLLLKLDEHLSRYEYSKLSTPIYMLLHHTDVFGENGNSIAELEKNIRILDKVMFSDVLDGAVIEEMFGGYSIELMDVNQAKEKLVALSKKGNYSMYAKTDNLLAIDGNGQNWNDIRHWSSSLDISKDNTVVEEDDEFFYLSNKQTGKKLEFAGIAKNLFSEEMKKNNRLHTFLINNANNMFAIQTESLNTTREIAKFAQEQGYDGVVLRNIKDNGGKNIDVGRDELADIYVFFSPNYIKSADAVVYNNNGEVIPVSERFKETVSDFRYSERDYTPDMELYADLQEESDKLKKDVENLKNLLKLQRTVTNGKLFTKTSVNAAASNLMKTFGMTQGKEKLAADLNEFYEFVASSEELDWDSVMSAAGKVADNAIRNAPLHEQRDDYAEGILKEIRTTHISLSEAQKQEVANKYDSFNNYRKHNMGSILLSNNGIDLETQWEIWHRSYPETFNIDVKEVDMPEVLAEIVSDLRQTRKMVKELDTAENRQMMINEIYDSYWGVSTLYTLADRNKREVDLLKSKHSLQTAELREQSIERYQQKVNLLNNKHNQQMIELRKRHKKREQDTKTRYRDMLNRLREKKNTQMTEYKQAVQTAKERMSDKKKRTEMRNKIKKVVNELDGLLNRGTKERNVKNGMRDMVKKALLMADVIFSEQDSAEVILSSGIKYATAEESALIKRYTDILEKRNDFQSRLDALLKLPDAKQSVIDDLLNSISYADRKLKQLEKQLYPVTERERMRLNEEVVYSAVDSLYNTYSLLQNATESYIKNGYDKNVADRLDTLRQALNGATADNMSLAQLTEVYDAYKMVLHTIRSVNEIFINGKKVSTEELASAVSSEILKSGKAKSDFVFELKPFRDFKWKEFKPVYAFEEVGSDTFLKLFNEARKGEDTFARDINDALQYSKNVREKYEYDNWDLDSRTKFIFDGQEVELSLAHMMSIYAYSKREQAHEHMFSGGFCFDTKETFRKEGKLWKYNHANSTAFRLNVNSLQKITDTLNDRQRKYVDEMQKYLSEVMGAKGNEVSKELYGIDLFKEKFYFPLQSSDDFLAPKNNPAAEISLRNSGMTKETVPHADNPIVLSNFDDVWSNHVNKMSVYHAMVLPIENLNKVHNFTFFRNSNTSSSVRTDINSVHGKEANEYITNFIRDLNGGIKMTDSTNIFSKMFSQFKKTAVSASISTVIQQPTAVLRATAMINPKYFVKRRSGLKHKALWSELQNYAPVALLKEWGGFDVGSNRQTLDVLNSTSYEGFDKAKAVFTDSKYRDEMLMFAAAKADELGWVSIWNAIKNEKAVENNVTADKLTQKMLEECGERFTDVVSRTQVYDSVFSRSEFMRSKNPLTQMSTAFMGEPTTTYNMLYHAVMQAKRSRISKKQAVRTVGAVIASSIAAVAAKSLIYALRDDDEDESYVEKYTSSFFGSLVDELFIPNMLPFVKDITSLFNGWDVERTDMAVFKDIRDAFQDLNSDSKSDWRKVEDLVGAIAAVFGIPAKNLMRTCREAYNLFRNIFDGVNSTGEGISSAAIEALRRSLPFLPDVTAEDNRKGLYDSYVSGKTSKIENAESKYKTESSLNTARKQALRDNDVRIKQAVAALVNGDYESYESFVKRILSEKHFEQDDITSSIQSERAWFEKQIAQAYMLKISDDDEWKDIVIELRQRYAGIYSQDEIVSLINQYIPETEDEESNSYSEKSIFNMTYVNEALMNGDTEQALQMIDEIIKVKKSNGKNEKESRAAVRTSLTSYWKPKYLDADSTQRNEIRKLLYKTGCYGTVTDLDKTLKKWRESQ